MNTRERGGVSRRELAVIGTCGLALFVALSLVFYAQILWLFAFGVLGLYGLSWVPWMAVLIIVPSGTVGILPGIVAWLIADRYPPSTVWGVSSVIVAVVLGLHDLLYGPVYLV